MPVWFSDWIKEQRVALGISQSELSDRTGKQIPQSTISMWEQWKTENPSAQNVRLVVESLGISRGNLSCSKIRTWKRGVIRWQSGFIYMT